MTGLPELYRAAARARGDDVAMTWLRSPHQGVRRTWRELVERSRQLADDIDAGPGDRVVVELADDPDLVPLLCALWDKGCVVVPVDDQWGQALRDEVAEHVGAHARMYFGERPGEVVVRGLTPPLGRPVLPDNVAMVAYTSGSTSAPKGVILTHDGLCHAYASAARRVRDLAEQRTTRFGAALRLSGLGVLGMNYLFAAALGSEVVVLPEVHLRSGAGWWDLVAEERLDLLYLVPAQLELLLRVGRPPAQPLRHVTCLTGSAPVRPELQQQIQEVTGVTLLNAYGMTEVSFASFFGRRLPDGGGAHDIGLPVTTKARLRPAAALEGADESNGASGELEMSGPSSALGYYDNDVATRSVFVDGWVRSGDLATVDAEGHYRIIGRAKNVVLRGGFTLHLDEVESFALRIDGVRDAGAVAVQTRAGEDFDLVVWCDAGTAPGDVLAGLREQLGTQRSPRRVLSVTEALPRTGNDKLDRVELGRWHAGLVGS